MVNSLFNFRLRSLHVLPSFPDVKEPAERVEKKSSSTVPSTLTSTVAAPSVKQSTSANNAEKESKKEVKEREPTTEKNVSKERSSTKESKRDKDENDGGSRKRERGEKRRERERKTISPVPYFDAAPIDRYYSNDQYDDRERDRDLSSISNSSNGSTNRRSQESPDHDRGITTIDLPKSVSSFQFLLICFYSLTEMKRRKIDKKNDDLTVINLEENTNKRERSSTKSKESKRDKSSYDDIEVRKEKRVSRKRAL